jgi:hypothetical protein
VVGGTACALVCFVIPPACALGLPRVPRYVAPDGHVTYHEPLFPWCSGTAAAALALALASAPPPLASPTKCADEGGGCGSGPG